MRSTCVLAAALLLAPALASAQEEGVSGRWSVTFTGGAAVAAGGEFHEGGSGSVLGLATTVEAKNNGDVFDPGIGWRGGIGHGISRNTELENLNDAGSNLSVPIAGVVRFGY